jgi:hypothetical protein
MRMMIMVMVGILVRQVVVRGHVETKSELIVQRVAERSQYVLAVG